MTRLESKHILQPPKFWTGLDIQIEGLSACVETEYLCLL